VLRNETQCLLLAAAGDEDGRVRTLQRLRPAERALETIVLAVEAGGLAGPHRLGDLERFREPLEALGDGRERHAETLGLALKPGGAQREIAAAAAKHVE